GEASACAGTPSRCSPTSRRRDGTWSPRGSPTWAGSPTTPPRSARTWWSWTRRTCARPSSAISRGSWRDRSCHLDRAAAAAARAGAYVMNREVVGLAGTAQAFGISERELVDDLNLLWCVELRAPDPYCPIDLSYEGGEIVVSQAESMGRPLR